MFTFRKQNQIGQILESSFQNLLIDAGLRPQKNPYTGTDSPARADYDLRIGDVFVEIKFNPAAEKTHNIALEIDILDISKADYFLISYPAPKGWYGYVLDRMGILKLFKNDRYNRVRAGQFGGICALVPTNELINYGVSVLDFIATQALERMAA